MAHEIEQMMYVGETPWHGLGRRIEKAPTIEEAIIAAGLDWKVKLNPLTTVVDGQSITVGHRAVVRESDASILGVVGPDYEPLQNTEAFRFFQPFVDAGEAEIHTAGSLRNGKRIWALAKLGRRPIEVGKGDEVEKFILLSNSHDGSMSVRAGFTPIRVVCANTLAMAHNNQSSELIRVRHTASVVANLDKIREIINIADRRFEATAEQFRFLSTKSINQKDLQKYVRRVFRMNEDGVDVSKQSQKIVDQVIALALAGRGSQLATAKGTYWGAYNALNEYLGYFRGKEQNTRLNSLWFGDAAKMNDRALQVATDMAMAA